MKHIQSQFVDALCSHEEQRLRWCVFEHIGNGNNGVERYIWVWCINHLFILIWKNNKLQTWCKGLGSYSQTVRTFSHESCDVNSFVLFLEYKKNDVSYKLSGEKKFSLFENRVKNSHFRQKHLYCGMSIRQVYSTIL